jgi:hypothetical protein
VTLNEADIGLVTQLEESLWRSETRFDLAHQEKVFASDFFEFGRSGRRYVREQMVRTEMQPIRARLPLQDFKIHSLDANHVLVTYVSEVQYAELERANRCSVWSRTEDGWKLRFHQGTPVHSLD